MNAQLASILSHYQQLSPEQKKTTFLFRFQLPYSYNPSQSLQNYHFVENLDLAQLSKSLPITQPEEECKDSATRKEEFKRNRRMDRKKLNSFFH